MPEEEKRQRQALAMATRAADKYRRAESDMLNAMRLARDEGASLWAIADATDVPHTTITERLQRAETR